MSRLQFSMRVLFLSALTMIPAINSQTVFEINPDSSKHPISPNIYGINALSVKAAHLTALEKSNIKSERLGGNRATGYNWETNASNAGSDYQHYSDAMMMGSPVSTDKGPAGVVVTFMERCKNFGRYPTVQLQMAGYVAADMTGAVTEAEAAPSPRWKKVIFQKNAPFLLTPDIKDSVVYIDEFVNFLVKKYGTAANGGVKSYCLDNEPGLWKTASGWQTHPRLHPQPVTIDEVLQKSGDLAKAVKLVDSTAEIYGLESWGWSEMDKFSSATGWDSFKTTYNWAISAYLGEMKKKSDAFGKRLLDVLSIHWYPEAKGDARITSDSTGGSEKTIQARLQAPRSLWDTTYKEDSWVANEAVKGPIKLIPRLKASIDTWYPGTKIAVNEFDYGGSKHFSGGLALTDVFGVFGREGVYTANLHTGVRGFLIPAFLLFVNFDGNYNMFGDTNVAATSPNIAEYSIYASLDSKNNKLLHIICINKKATESPIEMKIAGSKQYKSGVVFGFGKDSAVITKRPDIAGISANKFTYTLPPYSALHFILSTENTVELPVADFKTLDVGVIGGGKVLRSVEGRMHQTGTPLTLTAVADEGWTFYGWSGADSSKNTTLSIKMDNNKTVSAQFISSNDLVKNGDFSNEMSNWMPSAWSADNTSKGKASVVDSVLKYDIENGGKETWNVQIFQNTIPFMKGIKYTLSFDAWADAPHGMNVYCAKGVVNQALQLTTTKSPYTYTFTADSTDAAGKVSFDVGGGYATGKGTVYLDNVSIKADINSPVVKQGKLRGYGNEKEFLINLAKGKQIRFSSMVSSGPLTLMICDLSGRTLFSLTVVHSNNQKIVVNAVNINSLAQGMYLVRIKSSEVLTSSKVMIW